MNRRDFFGRFAQVAAVLYAGSMVAKADNLANFNDEMPRSPLGFDHRMAGGACSDFRMMEKGPSVKWEREIFGA